MEKWDMSNVIISQKQDNAIRKLLDEATKRGVNIEEAKGKLLQLHVKKGWKDVTDKSLLVLDELSIEEFATVLFSDNYKVEKEKLKLQVYEVTFKVNKPTTLINRVSKENMEELSKNQIIESALKNLKSAITINSKQELSEDAVSDIKTITLE